MKLFTDTEVGLNGAVLLKNTELKFLPSLFCVRDGHVKLPYRIVEEKP